MDKGRIATPKVPDRRQSGWKKRVVGVQMRLQGRSKPTPNKKLRENRQDMSRLSSGCSKCSVTCVLICDAHARHIRHISHWKARRGACFPRYELPQLLQQVRWKVPSPKPAQGWMKKAYCYIMMSYTILIVNIFFEFLWYSLHVCIIFWHSWCYVIIFYHVVAQYCRIIRVTQHFMNCKMWRGNSPAAW